MTSIEKLTERFTKFPGIGRRQAGRFVYFLVQKNPAFLDEMVKEIENIKEHVSRCQSCYRFYEKAMNDTFSFCNLCRDENADQTTMLVLEKDADLENVRKSSTYKGKFFILGGTLPFLKEDADRYIRSSAFIAEVERRMKSEGLGEVIFALGATPEGEHTVGHLKSRLDALASFPSLKISTLGRGLSTGAEIEYTDSETITNALKNRS